MSIVTFYSYKGGVGRSMALANVGFELSKKGLRVLMVDWDLEAPGLEKYFTSYQINAEGLGLLPLLLDAKKDSAVDYKKYLWTIQIPSNTLSLLHSGREKFIDYAQNLEAFDWKDFFSLNQGGVFLEKLRIHWKSDFDIVLIDSRTGLSDVSGICTIFLPDIIVPMFTANYQSLNGVRDILRLTQEARQNLDVDRLPLSILPIPARFGTRAEFKQSQEWLDRFAETLSEFYSDWLPLWIKPRQVLERLKIPQIDYFGFGEKLAVVDAGTSDPEGMGFVYSKIAAFLASDFKDVKSLVGEDYEKEKQKYQQQKTLRAGANAKPEFDYVNDIYISYSPDVITTRWISDFFLPVFKSYLTQELGRVPVIYFDRTEINIGIKLMDQLKYNLSRSRMLVTIMTDLYQVNFQTLAETLTFRDRSKALNTNLIQVVKLKMVTDFSKDLKSWDFTEFSTAGEGFSKTPEYVDFLNLMKSLSIEIANTLKAIPPFDPEWSNMQEYSFSASEILSKK
ncbi:MAG: ParA family protein [Chitinophagales bacterium]